ncbi:MAG: hypothetical protein PHT07_00580 [Paludibacter sp.]|nr:hypothetical protein [Paludibacter sp.]
MKKLIILSVLFSIHIGIFAQINSISNSKDTIQILNNAQGTSYYHAGEKLNNNNLKSLMSKNTKASKEFSRYKELSGGASVLMIGGAALMTYGFYKYKKLENTFPAGSYNSAPLMIGIGAVVVSIPVLIVSKSHLRNSVVIYNNSITNHTDRSLSLHFIVNPNGVGLQMTF